MKHEIDETLIKWVDNFFSVGGAGRGERVRFTIRAQGPMYATTWTKGPNRERALKRNDG